MAYPKVMRAYFPFQEILFHNHTPYLCKLDMPVFMQIMTNVQHGLKWINPPHDISVSSECASALYHLVEFRFRSSKQEVEALACLEKHLAESNGMFGSLLALLIESALDDCPNRETRHSSHQHSMPPQTRCGVDVVTWDQVCFASSLRCLLLTDDFCAEWALSRPMLGLILTNGEAFEQIKLQICETLPGDHRERMGEAMGKLMDGVNRNLESRNRDRFTQNLSAFRHEVKAFMQA